MECNESPISLKALGAEMRELRREYGLSIARLAFMMGKPAWLLDVIEHAGVAVTSGLCSLIPQCEIRSVQEAFRRVQRTTWSSGMRPQRKRSALSAEHTFYLPVTISPDSLTDAMKDVTTLAAESPESAAARQQILRQCVVSVSMLACLLHEQHRREGNEQAAQECLVSFRKNLQERTRICY